jgi:hypothetical protein
MITLPTVLVLGAGASSPYGYPSGGELKQKVINLLGNSNLVQSTLIALGNHASDLDMFRQALSRSGRGSVDAFLEYRPELIELGKQCIAVALLQCEDEDALFRTDQNWYDRLFQAMSAEFSVFAENKVSVVTFNYDRSLEQYLYHTLTNAYGESSLSVRDTIRDVKIVHVHGQLGPLPWQDSAGRPYAPTQTPDHVLSAAKGIRIISEAAELQEGFGPARELLYKAERVIFLGFGFNRVNFDRLAVDAPRRPREYFASAYGMTDIEVNTIIKMFHPHQLVTGPWPCLDFLRHRVEL